MMKARKKIVLMTAIAAFSLAAFLGGCKKDDFVESPGLCPLVLSTDPANGAVSVPLNQVITVTFNKEMNPATITQLSFSVQGATKIAGTITYSGSTASFTPTDPLTPNTTYTGIVTTSVKDVHGNALQADYVWTFSTGLTLSPVVISTDPANNATGVPLNKIITATFSVPMNPLTITTSTFTLNQGTTAIAGTVTYSGSTATFTPSVPLAPNTVYTGTISSSAADLLGNTLQDDYVWSFSTGTNLVPLVTSTDPANNATGVFLNKIIAATFNTAMNPLTLTTSTFTLKQGTTSVNGTILYSGTTVYFTPSSPLSINSIYTATITTGAKDLAGVSLANDYVWTFTTGTVLAPRVISTEPVNNATAVILNKIITATFSEAMDPATINTSTFSLKLGAQSVAGTVTYSGTTATFTPSANLSANSTYTATITTGAKNPAAVPLAANYVWKFSTATNVGAPVVVLGAAEQFGILAGVGISNNAGQSEIHDMNVGISPGVRSSITGFPPAIIVNGVMYASNDIAPPGVPAMLTQAKQALTDAYLFAEGAVSPAPATISGDIGGRTLAPGIYKSTSTLMIGSGDLTLDAQGDANAVWIFQIASGFTTIGGAGGNVILSGGAQAKNVFWQTGSSATIGDYTSFKGNILALTSITMNSHATATGRMLARNGSVVMTSTNIINKP